LRIFLLTIFILISGCAAQQQATQLRNAEEQILRKELQVAMANATVECNTKESCDKAFSLTKVYVQQNSGMRVQISDDTMVSSFNSNQGGRVGLSAVKVPGAGQTASIKLSATCQGMDYQYAFMICGEQLKRIFQGFKPFVESRIP
jgi:hypothetical protein